MDSMELARRVEAAKALSEGFPEHRSEVFTAILTASLVNEESPKPGAVRLGSSSPRATTATEFFSQLRPSQDVDKALVAAYFMDVFRNKGDFTAEELRTALLEAKVSPPKNLSLAVLRNAQRGLIAQKDKQGKKITWLITQSGIEKVNEMSREAVAGKN